MRFRTATIDDVTELVRLEREIFPQDAWPDSLFRDEIRGDHNHLVVVERDGRIIGYGAAQAIAGNELADIHTIALVESERGKGIGAELLDTVMEWCVRQGATAIMLEVRADNDVAQALYRSRGFERIAVRPQYYRQAGVDAVVMRREVLP